MLFVYLTFLLLCSVIRVTNFQNAELVKYYSLVTPMVVFFGGFFFLGACFWLQQDIYAPRKGAANKLIDLSGLSLELLKQFRWVVSLLLMGLTLIFFVLKATAYRNYGLERLLQIEYILSVLKEFSYGLFGMFATLLVLNLLLSLLEGKDSKYGQFLYDVVVLVLFLIFAVFILPSFLTLNTVLSYYSIINYGIENEPLYRGDLERVKPLLMKAVETGLPDSPSTAVHLQPNQLGTLIVNEATGDINACLDIQKTLDMCTENMKNDSWRSNVESFAANQGAGIVKKSMGVPDMLCTKVGQFHPEKVKPVLDAARKGK